jgi:hypothetical protein
MGGRVPSCASGWVVLGVSSIALAACGRVGADDLDFAVRTKVELLEPKDLEHPLWRRDISDRRSVEPRSDGDYAFLLDTDIDTKLAPALALSRTQQAIGNNTSPAVRG